MDRRSTANRRPRVISIPVHFVQSEQTQSASALKIQKAFRGFLVRKSMRQIRAIMNQVVEIERRIESVKEVGIDAKERLRLNETLMALLLKLDSVRGICNGVRECRKRVIKKAIALQDKVDSIPSAAAAAAITAVVSDSVPDLEPVDRDCPIDEEKKPIASPDQVDSTAAVASDSVPEPDPDDKDHPIDEDKKLIASPEQVNSAVVTASDFVPDSDAVGDEAEMKVDSTTAAASDFVPDSDAVGDEAEMKVDSATAIASDVVTDMENQEEEKTIHCMITDEDDHAAVFKSSSTGRSFDPEVEGEEERERKRSREYLLERMVEENEKLVGMVRELNEKSEMQARLLNSLAQRVELLEKTVVCDKLARMKKKKQRHGGNNNCN